MSARNDIERIEWVAVRTPNGKIYKSKIGHFNASMKAWAAGDESAVVEDGFITNTGRFVDREEAYQIALKSQQHVNLHSLAKSAMPYFKKHGPDLLASEELDLESIQDDMNNTLEKSSYDDLAEIVANNTVLLRKLGHDGLTEPDLNDNTPKFFQWILSNKNIIAEYGELMTGVYVVPKDDNELKADWDLAKQTPSTTESRITEGDAQPGYDIPIIFRVSFMWQGQRFTKNVEATKMEQRSWAINRAICSVLKKFGVSQDRFAEIISSIRSEDNNLNVKMVSGTSVDSPQAIRFGNRVGPPIRMGHLVCNTPIKARQLIGQLMEGTMITEAQAVMQQLTNVENLITKVWNTAKNDTTIINKDRVVAEILQAFKSVSKAKDLFISWNKANITPELHITQPTTIHHD
jgi:hypothetical protein